MQMDGSLDFPLTSTPLAGPGQARARRRRPKLAVMKAHHGNHALGLILLGFILGAAAAIALMMHVQRPETPALLVRVPVPALASPVTPPHPATLAAPLSAAALPTRPASPSRPASPISVAPETADDAAATGMTSRRVEKPAVEVTQLF